MFNTPAILDKFLISTLETVLTAMIFGLFRNPSVYSWVPKYQLWQHALLYWLMQKLVTANNDWVLGATRQENFMDTRSSLFRKYSCHQLYLCEMLFSVSEVPWLLIFTMKWNNMFYNFSERPSTISNLVELRWYMFSRHQYESDKLPPTKMALDQGVLWAHYTALTWKSAHISSPILSYPKYYGWTLNEITNLYHPIPIMTKIHLFLIP